MVVDSGTRDSSHDDAAASDGGRSALTAPCDDNDPTRCLLPWPSNTFTAVDRTTTTGLRVAVAASSLEGDDPWSLNQANGFSRVTPLMTGFAKSLDRSTLDNSNGQTALRLLVAQPDHPRYGQQEPLRFVILDEAERSLVVGYPQRPLAAAADHVAVVLDSLRSVDGQRLPVSRATQLALAVIEPETDAEQALVDFHAPTRALLDVAGIDPDEVIRLWRFTTRSERDSTRWVESMRRASTKAVDDGEVTVVIDAAMNEDDPAIAVVVEGRLRGLPLFIGDDGRLSVDEAGQPRPVGKTDASFRVAVPAGEGDYRVAMYGHGTGGTFRDSSFDEAIAGLGLAKVGIEFRGWTETTLLQTLLQLDQIVAGTHKATAKLLQSIADGAAIQRALSGDLGEQLAAEQVGTLSNPAVGRGPDLSVPVWVGGSLAGTMGFVFACTSDEIAHGVVSVPGVAWSHWVDHSDVVGTYLQAMLLQARGDWAGVVESIVYSQLTWDPIDGASWLARPDCDDIFLIQESIGDTILPNEGSEMAATAAGALHVGKALRPIAGVDEADEAVGRSGITQFRVASAKPLDIHGFGGKNDDAGKAAREQIESFLTSVREGKPRITVPEGCPTAGCDFSDR